MGNYENPEMERFKKEIGERLDRQEQHIDSKMSVMCTAIEQTNEIVKSTSEQLSQYLIAEAKREEREKHQEEKQNRTEDRLNKLEDKVSTMHDNLLTNSFKTDQNYSFLQKHGPTIAATTIIIGALLAAFGRDLFK